MRRSFWNLIWIIYTVLTSWQGDGTALKCTRVGSVEDGPSSESDSTGLMERDNGKKGGGIRGASAQSEDLQTQAKNSSNLRVDQGPSQNTQQTSKITESENKTSTSKVKKQSRMPCPYGSSCYRYRTARLLSNMEKSK